MTQKTINKWAQEFTKVADINSNFTELYAGGSASTAPVNFIWSNATSSASIADTSVAIADSSSNPVHFTITGGAGLTANTTAIDGALDVGLTNWVTLGSAILSSAGVAQINSDVPYFGYRARAINLTGGTISVAMKRGANVGNLGKVITNPTLTGIPVITPMVLGQSAIVVLNPSSATAGAGGTFTGMTALPNAYTSAWIAVPTGAYTGLTTGRYYAEFSSATAGTIYNILLGADETPYTPTSAQKTANPVTNAAGTWTAFTASDKVLISVLIPAGAMGNNGFLRVSALYTANGTATSAGLSFGALGALTADHNIGIAGNSGVGYQVTFSNRGVANKQITTATSASGEFGLLAANLRYLSIDTSINQYINFYSNAGATTSGNQLERFVVEVVPA